MTAPAGGFSEIVFSEPSERDARVPFASYAATLLHWLFFHLLLHRRRRDCHASVPRLKSATCSRNSGLENEDDLTYELLHDDVVTADHLPSQSITGAAFHIVCALLRWT